MTWSVSCSASKSSSSGGDRALQAMGRPLGQNLARRPRRVFQVIRHVIEKLLNAVRIFQAAQLAQFLWSEVVDGTGGVSVWSSRHSRGSSVARRGKSAHDFGAWDVGQKLCTLARLGHCFMMLVPLTLHPSSHLGPSKKFGSLETATDENYRLARSFERCMLRAG